jgi:isopenicillin N synthase-like dioxygenase
MSTMSAAPSPVNTSDAAEIPVLDLAPYLSGQSAAREKLARQLCHALENIGFYFIKGHGVPQSLIDAAFAATARFHAQPLDRKMKLRRNRDNVGYLPMSRSDDPEAVIKPNVNEAFFLKRDLPADHPDVVAGKRFRGANLWPDDLPGFREAVVAYCDAKFGAALRRRSRPTGRLFRQGVRRATIHAPDDALSVCRGARRK